MPRITDVVGAKCWLADRLERKANRFWRRAHTRKRLLEDATRLRLEAQHILERFKLCG